MAPHVYTRQLVAQALNAVERLEPELVESVDSLLATADSKGRPLQASTSAKLHLAVHQALRQAWQLDPSIHDASRPGEAT
jgi:hypothetical protein